MQEGGGYPCVASTDDSRARVYTLLHLALELVADLDRATSPTGARWSKVRTRRPYRR